MLLYRKTSTLKHTNQELSVAHRALNGVLLLQMRHLLDLHQHRLGLPTSGAGDSPTFKPQAFKRHRP